MTLTDRAIRNAKPSTSPIKLFDERGLFLHIAPAGGKWWRFRYQFQGKEKLLSLGTYPDVALKDARARRDEARKLLANGVDPSVHRKLTKAAQLVAGDRSFEAVTREWFAKHSPGWATSHSDRVIRRFERDIFPWLGTFAICDVTVPQLLAVARNQT